MRKRYSMEMVSSTLRDTKAFVTPETNGSQSPSSVASRQNNKHFLLPSSIYTKRPLKLVPTVTKSSLTIVTEIDTTSVVCAKLVNVTGPCLRRRGAWVEEPIVLSFHDGDFDDAFDLVYSPVLRVETTAAPESTTFDESGLKNDPSTAVASSVRDSEENQRLNGLTFFFFRGITRWFFLFSHSLSKLRCRYQSTQSFFNGPSPLHRHQLLSIPCLFNGALRRPFPFHCVAKGNRILTIFDSYVKEHESVAQI